MKPAHTARRTPDSDLPLIEQLRRAVTKLQTAVSGADPQEFAQAAARVHRIVEKLRGAAA